MIAAHYSSIVVLTGAGISAESGLRTFRDNNGLWENHRVDDVATPEGFAQDPALVHRFYNQRRAQLREVRPNRAHSALGQFEQCFKGEFLIVTQNVDNLHELGGSRNIVHMHGELLKIRCNRCADIIVWEKDVTTHSQCPQCRETNCLRPHIVWFGEIPMRMEEIELALSNCDLFVSIGTSGNVYPAAGFVRLARAIGAHCVELNLEASNGASAFNEHIYGQASQIVPAFFQCECEYEQ